jgi:tetratricopeptide (TPR) repeat protein
LKRISSLLVVLAALVAACTPTPPPAAAPEITERHLIDPRIGYDKPAAPKVDRQFDTAWQYFLAGDFATARMQLDAIRKREPSYLPAALADAAIDIREGKLDRARTAVERAETRVKNYTAARVYEAEIAVVENRPRRAYEIYRDIAAQPNAPASFAARIADLQKLLFDQAYHDALSAPPAEAIRLLRDALQFEPGASAARVLLVQKLLAQKRVDEARQELDPILNSGDADRAEVQEALAEIDAGHRHFQEAINRYERLAKRNPDPRYTARLDELKEQFASENMPPQYRRALESDSITRSDFAVLLYWKVSSVRFAQNLSTPPIAIDIAEVPGREELVRAITIGVLNVDPVTRRVGPNAAVNVGGLTRLGARVLAARGAACAHGVGDPVKTLAACGIPDPSTYIPPESPVDGRTASTMLSRIDRALSR